MAESTSHAPESAARRPEATDPPSLTGTVEAIVFANEANGFVVARLRPASGPERSVTIVGYMEGLASGQRVSVRGRWVTHPRYGVQLQVTRHARACATPAAEGCRSLDARLAQAIGPILAERIRDHFGDATPAVLDRAPQRLQEVAGIGPRRAERIAEAWRTRREVREVMSFLRAYGVGPAHAVRIFQIYGREAPSRLRERPYRLTDEGVGLGFRTADRVALKMGVAPAAPERIRAALRHTLTAAARDGQDGLGRDELVARCARLIDLDPAKHRGRLERELDRLAAGEDAFAECGGAHAER